MAFFGIQILTNSISAGALHQTLAIPHPSRHLWHLALNASSAPSSWVPYFQIQLLATLWVVHGSSSRHMGDNMTSKSSLFWLFNNQSAYLFSPYPDVIEDLPSVRSLVSKYSVVQKKMATGSESQNDTKYFTRLIFHKYFTSLLMGSLMTDLISVTIWWRRTRV